LYLTVGTSGSNGSISGGTISKITSNSWTENTLTYANQPSLSNALALSSLGTVAQGKTYAFDLKNSISSPGIYSYAITSRSSDGVDYYSKEATDQTRRPYLVIEFAN